MKCPDCAGNIVPVSVLGFDDSFRCGSCGGVLVPNWVVNNLAEGKVLIISKKGGVSGGAGTVSCPVDGQVLGAAPEEMVPEGLRIRKCGGCNRWWFGKDDVFEYAAALVAKKAYMGAWQKKSVWQYAFPALVLAVMAVGVIVGVELVQRRQQVAIEASQGVEEFSVSQEKGETVIRFKLKQPVSEIKVKEVNDLKYQTYVAQSEGEYEELRLVGLKQGHYQVKIMEAIYYFRVE